MNAGSIGVQDKLEKKQRQHVTRPLCHRGSAVTTSDITIYRETCQRLGQGHRQAMPLWAFYNVTKFSIVRCPQLIISTVRI